MWNPFKKKVKEPPFNVNHPDLADKVEFAFEAGPALKKVKYYKFIKDYQSPTGRYKWIDAFLYESELRMDMKRLNAYMDELEKHLDGSKGVVNISGAFKVMWAIRSRCKLAFSPETIKRLASVVYFDSNEDLSDYNQDYAEKKVEFWEKYGCYDFFLTSPIRELLNLRDGSETYLPNYIQEVEKAMQLIEDLTYVPESQS